MRIAQLVVIRRARASSWSRSTELPESERGVRGFGPRRLMALREPRIRVSAILRWQDRILLCRHEKPGAAVLAAARRRRQVRREPRSRRCSASWPRRSGSRTRSPVEGPIAIVDSISPERRSSSQARRPHHLRRRPQRALARGASPRSDDAVRGHRLFDAARSSTDVVIHPPIQRFLRRWQPGDPTVYLGSLWAP